MADFISDEITVTPYCGPFAVGLAGIPAYLVSNDPILTVEAARQFAKDFYTNHANVELYIFATNGIGRRNNWITPSGWTVIDTLDADTYADGRQTVYERFESEKADPAGTPIDFGYAVADADYTLDCTTDGMVTVYALIGVDGLTKTRALGNWAFRIGGGAWDLPNGNSRNYSGSTQGSLVEAQDEFGETPVVSCFTMGNNTPIIVAFFGVITNNLEMKNDGSSYEAGSNFNNLGIENNFVQYLGPHIEKDFVYGTANQKRLDTAIAAVPFTTRNDVRWVDSSATGYPPLTNMPCLLGPIVPQATLDSLTGLSIQAQETHGITGRSTVPTVQIFVPRPNDTFPLDDLKTAGRYLSGYRARFVTVRRYSEALRQETMIKGIRVKGYEWTFGENITTRFLCPPPRNFSNPYSSPPYHAFSYTTTFQFDRIETIPTEPAFASPTDTHQPFVGPLAGTGLPAGTGLTLNPYWMEYGTPFTSYANGQLVQDYVPGRLDFPDVLGTDKYLLRFTELREVVYALSAVYVNRLANGTETFDYGPETLTSIAIIPSRCEGLTVSADPLLYSLEGAEHNFGEENPVTGKSYHPVWRTYYKHVDAQGTDLGRTGVPDDFVTNNFVSDWSIAGANHGALIEEKWGGIDAERNAFYAAQKVANSKVEYVGFAYNGFNTGSPPPPFNWVTYRETLGSSIALTPWGNYYYFLAHITYNDGSGNIQYFTQQWPDLPGNSTLPGWVNGDALKLRGWTKMNAFENGGSVPYSMPYPYAANLAELGFPSINSDIQKFNGRPKSDFSLAFGWVEVVKREPQPGSGNPVVTDIYFQHANAFYPDAPQGPPNGSPPKDPGYMYFTGTITLYIGKDAPPFSFNPAYLAAPYFQLNDGTWGYLRTIGKTEAIHIHTPPFYQLEDAPSGQYYVGFDQEYRTAVGQAGQYIASWEYPHYASGPKKFHLASNYNIDESVILDSTPNNITSVDDTNFHQGIASPEIGKVGVFVMNGKNGPIAVPVYDRPQRYKPSIQPTSIPAQVGGL